jgi:hypothetical protein
VPRRCPSSRTKSMSTTETRSPPEDIARSTPYRRPTHSLALRYRCPTVSGVIVLLGIVVIGLGLIVALDRIGRNR